MCDSELEEGRSKEFCCTSCRVQYQMLLIDIEGIHGEVKSEEKPSLSNTLNKALTQEVNK